MGFVRKGVQKLTGVDDQVAAMEANAAAQEAATKAAASRQTQELQQTAQAAADQQAMLAARDAAETKAKDVASAPLEQAEVQLDPNPAESASQARRSKRAAFGKNYGSGVSL
jgi:hypothetical protein